MKPRLADLAQIVCQDTGRSLADIQDQTPLSNPKGEDRSGMIAEHCLARWGESMLVLPGMTFGDVCRQLGLNPEPKREKA